MATKKTGLDGVEMPINHSVESRLSKAETELESVSKDIGLLTSDVRSLASSVRTQGEQFDTQLRQLHIAVTAASGPRKTEWQVILVGVGLAISIGTAALSPMYARLADLHKLTEKYEERFDEHVKLKLHPVGESRINSLEENLEDKEKRFKEEVARLTDDIKDMKDKRVPSMMERMAVLEDRNGSRKNQEPH